MPDGAVVAADPRYLQATGRATPPPGLAAGRTDAESELLEDYRRWCVAQRGLTSTTADEYVRRVAVFLVLWRPDGRFVVADLDGGAILNSIAVAAEVMPSPSLRCMVTALRSFLRFLHATGRLAASLVTAVPTLKTWPRTTLPSVLPAGDARRLVAACDSTTFRGRRDAAIVLVMLRLGLRASEVGRLELDDIDWRAGEMTIRGKGGRRDRLPLPVEVGEAIVAYLREGRPASACRSVFLTVTAPIVAFAPPTVSRTSFAESAPERAWRVSDRTRCAARWQPRRSEPGRRWPRSPSCSATWTRRLRRSTRPPTAPRWRRCRSRGRRCGDERSDLAQQRRGLPGYALSFGFRLSGYDGPLADFVTYLQRMGLDTVTVESALAWAVEAHTTPLRHAQRLSIARGFATYLHALDSRCEVPARGLLPVGRRRVPPHIYSPHEIDQLIARAASCVLRSAPRRSTPCSACSS